MVVALAAALGVAIVTAGCTTTRAQVPSRAADEAAIAEFNKRYLQAINDGDIAALSSLTTDEHIMIAPGRPPLVGKAANDEANGRAFQQFRIEETWAPLETVMAGDWAYQRGTPAAPWDVHRHRANLSIPGSSWRQSNSSRSGSLRGTRAVFRPVMLRTTCEIGHNPSWSHYLELP